MADNSTQANIDDLVKELSRPQSVPPKGPSVPTPGKNASSAPLTPPKPPVMPSKPPVAAPNAPKQYDSSIRTMSDDLSHLKSGQKLQGVDIPRTVQPAPTKPSPVVPQKPHSSIPTPPKPPVMPSKPPVAPIMPPPTKTTPPSMPSMAAPQKPPIPAPKPPTLPKPQPAKPAPTPAVKPPQPDSKGQFYVPENNSPSGGNRNLLFVGIAIVAVILAVVYWFFFIRQPAPEPVPTPTATVTPTATPLSDLETIFPNKSGTIILPASGNPASAFSSALATQTVPAGSAHVLTVENTVASSSVQTLDVFSLMDRFLISYPAALKTSGSSGNSAILAYGQQETFDSKGKPVTGQAPSQRLILVSEVASSSMTTLQSWEPDMATSLEGLMGINHAQAATKTFQDTNYNGVAIRFMNFPYPDHTIDYAVIPYNGKYYLVLASSREAMFAAIDAFKVPGK